MSTLPIGRDTVVSLKIEMYDAQGELLEASEAPVTYLHGGYEGIPAGLERALDGKLAGEEVRVQVEPEDAFGEYDAELLRVEPVERYGDGLEVGMQIEDRFEGGETRTYTVTDLAGDRVVLDGNHPLAGIALRFFCQVLSVRAAKPEEISRGASLP